MVKARRTIAGNLLGRAGLAAYTRPEAAADTTKPIAPARRAGVEIPLGDAASVFVHLHNHSEYSLLDGACRLAELAGRAAAEKMPAVALTDHGNLHGAVEFYQACRKAKVKPVIGIEAYVAPEGRTVKRARGIREAGHHLVLLAENNAGYRNLLKLATIGHLEGFYYRPRIDKECLAEHHEGLICLTACLKGEVPSLVLAERYDEAKAVLEFFKELFGDDHVFVELQNHGIDDETRAMPVLAQLAEQVGIGTVVTNDIHYIARDDALMHDCLLCLQTQSVLSDANRMKFQTPEFYFKTEAEMRALFPDNGAALDATAAIAERCHVELDLKTRHYPVFKADAADAEGDVDLAEYLRALCERGLRERFGEAQPPAEYVAQMDYELDVIDKRGLTSYILIVWDFIHYAREHGIPVGPGRGSATGSLVCCLTGITDIDPIRYKLVFERFTSLERPTFPDIDVDLCMERRGEVIDYVRRKYGEDHVAQIITFGTLGAKASIRDIGRVLGHSYGDVDRIARLVPGGPGVTLDRALKQERELRTLYETDEMTRQIIDIAKRAEGLARNASTHAAGLVISSEPLTDIVPLCHGGGDEVVTQFAMKPVGDVGLLKMDFLGLKTLTVIHHAVENIAQTQGTRLDIRNVALDDPKTLELLNRADTGGLFQLESSGMTDLARNIGIDRFEDIVAMIALFRPGPMEMIPEYIARKKDPAKIKYAHPQLEPVLAETYGIFVYQEQVMQAANVLAGYSLGEADILRRAMGKKKPAEMKAQRERFLGGAKTNKIHKKTAEKVFGEMERFAGYGFNKSHAAAYAMIVYQTAFLKANYPREYMAALLSNEMGNTDKISRTIAECDAHGIDILPPDMNESFARFTVVDEGIRFGLAAIRNVGAGAVEHILERRQSHGPYTSLDDFAGDVDPRVVNRKMLESLVHAGAFDSLGWNRAQLVHALPQVLDGAARRHADRLSGQVGLFDALATTDAAAALHMPPPDIEEFPLRERLAREKELLGFYVTGHPLSDYRELIEQLDCSPLAQLGAVENRARVKVATIIAGVRNRITRKTNERMAVLELDDGRDTIEALVFPRAYRQCGSIIEKDLPVLAVAGVDRRDERPKLIVDALVPLDQAERDGVEAVDRLIASQQSAQPANGPRRYRGAHGPPAPANNGPKALRVTIDRRTATAETLEQINALAADAPGDLPLVLAFTESQGSPASACVRTATRVNPHDALMQAITEIPAVVTVEKSLSETA
jgi:DNA polymerase-3 subunit alpha